MPRKVRRTPKRRRNEQRWPDIIAARHANEAPPWDTLARDEKLEIYLHRAAHPNCPECKAAEARRYRFTA